eukprot:COSAG06_NODE_2363_length_7003_cov_5.261008_2_plen_788_part_00
MGGTSSRSSSRAERDAAQSVRRGATPLGRPRARGDSGGDDIGRTTQAAAPPGSGGGSRRGQGGDGGGEHDDRLRPTPPPPQAPRAANAKQLGALEASVVWHQQAAKAAAADMASVAAALAAAEERVATLERASQEVSEAHADCVRTLTGKLETLTAQADRARLSEEELEQALSDARDTIDALRDEAAAAASDNARKVAQLERRCEKMQWRHLEQELHEVQEREAAAAAQHAVEMAELQQTADQVPVLQELALSWRIVVERMEQQLEEEHATTAKAVHEREGLEGSAETQAAMADGTIARLSARVHAGDQQAAALGEALKEWRRKGELDKAAHAAETEQLRHEHQREVDELHSRLSAVGGELRECKATLVEKNSEIVKLFTEIKQREQSQAELLATKRADFEAALSAAGSHTQEQAEGHTSAITALRQQHHDEVAELSSKLSGVGEDLEEEKAAHTGALLDVEALKERVAKLVEERDAALSATEQAESVGSAAVLELSDELAEERAAHAQTNERALRLLKRATEAKEREEARVADEVMATAAAAAAAQEAQLRMLWQQLDQDGSGTLGRTEVHQLLTDMNLSIQSTGYRSIERHLDAAMDEIDLDGDGRVDFEELFTWWKQQDATAQTDAAHALADREAERQGQEGGGGAAAAAAATVVLEQRIAAMEADLAASAAELAAERLAHAKTNAQKAKAMQAVAVLQQRQSQPQPQEEQPQQEQQQPQQEEEGEAEQEAIEGAGTARPVRAQSGEAVLASSSTPPEPEPAPDPEPVPQPQPQLQPQPAHKEE